MNNLIELESVGSFIDKESGITYPALENGKPDLEDEVHILECDSEWMTYLSQDDRAIVDKIKANLEVS
tara:strand:+ start:3538 stop:3741 length:204 start_codon:yes stop_codon:yes gene_type:complete